MEERRVHDALLDRMGTGYGYQWWIDEGAFSARGRGGQYLYVIPSAEIVLVTSGSASPENEARLDELLAGWLLPAMRSDHAPPPAPEAFAALQARVAEAAEPPPPTPPDPLPALGQAIDGQVFSLEPNLLGWDALRLSFAEEEGALELTIGGVTSTLVFGLDGVAREGHAERFAATERLTDVDVALDAEWLDQGTLELRFDTLDRIDAGTVTVTVEGGGESILVDLYERTFLLSHVVVAGTAALP